MFSGLPEAVEIGSLISKQTINERHFQKDNTYINTKFAKKKEKEGLLGVFLRHSMITFLKFTF
jgi:hypothetical protein